MTTNIKSLNASSRAGSNMTKKNRCDLCGKDEPILVEKNNKWVCPGCYILK